MLCFIMQYLFLSNLHTNSHFRLLSLLNAAQLITCRPTMCESSQLLQVKGQGASASTDEISRVRGRAAVTPLLRSSDYRKERELQLEKRDGGRRGGHRQNE